jgi:serine/threonine protein kinase
MTRSGSLELALVKKGAVIGSDATGRSYRIASDCVAEGGFGEVYRGELLNSRRNPVADVAIKVMTEPEAWHGEAYFGQLLADHDRVVRFLDAFQRATGSGAARVMRYFLVFEWIEDGTLNDLFEVSSQPQSERAVTKQTKALLQVLGLLHRRGICHGDITPRNVFLRDGELVLGDLGIAKQSLVDGPLELIGSTPAIFCPNDAWWDWTPSDDVYQLGLIALSALAGEIVTTDEVCGRLLKSVTASDHLKGWIRQCLLPRPKRFKDASAALDALNSPPPKPARAPKSLQDQVVVFTGIMDRTRADASRLAKKAGASVQNKVTTATTLVVTGRTNVQQSPHCDH